MQVLMLSLVPRSLSAKVEPCSKTQFFPCPDPYCAVQEDKVGGFSVTTCTDLQKDCEIIQN